MMVAEVLHESRCTTKLWGASDGLRCERAAGHDFGCVYVDNEGSAVADRHLDG